MSSKKEYQIAASLYRRDPISTDPRKRKIYEHEAYHWGILITRGDVCDAYDATDSNKIDPITFRQQNPTQDWIFQVKRGVNSLHSAKFLGSIIIGSVPPSMSRDDIEAFLRAIPLPKKNQDPQQSCVTWVANVVRALQQKNHVHNFDVNKFLDRALLFADEWLGKDKPGVAHYDDVLGLEK